MPAIPGFRTVCTRRGPCARPWREDGLVSPREAGEGPPPAARTAPRGLEHQTPGTVPGSDTQANSVPETSAGWGGSGPCACHTLCLPPAVRWKTSKERPSLAHVFLLGHALNPLWSLAWKNMSGKADLCKSPRGNHWGQCLSRTLN